MKGIKKIYTRKDEIKEKLTQEILNECYSYAAVLRYLEIPDSSSAQKGLK